MGLRLGELLHRSPRRRGPLLLGRAQLDGRSAPVRAEMLAREPPHSGGIDVADYREDGTARRIPALAVRGELRRSQPGDRIFGTEGIETIKMVPGERLGEKLGGDAGGGGLPPTPP